MHDFIDILRKDFPKLHFTKGDMFCWSPQTRTILYKEFGIVPQAQWTLLHELSHALLEHITYETDVELLHLEVAAWNKAQEIAEHYNIVIDNVHIQNCLDSYRNWLHRRSTCPNCHSHSLQSDSHHYECYNCHAIWKVTAARFCRPYRKIERHKETSPTAVLQVTFQ